MSGGGQNEMEGRLGGLLSGRGLERRENGIGGAW